MEVISAQFAHKATEYHPAAKFLQVIPPSAVPFPPSPLDVVEVKDNDRERKNIQADMKHMPKSIESTHNRQDRVLHFFWSQRLVGNKERKVSIIVLPTDALFGKHSILFLEPLGQLRTGYGNRKKNLDGVDLGLFDESPKMSIASSSSGMGDSNPMATTLIPASRMA
jgi:hypothetical protein